MNSRHLTRLFRSILARSGYFSTPAVAESQLTEFLKRLQPYETDKTLIRLGGDGDGGYLVPDDLKGIEYCFSPGVSTTSVFEEELLSRGIKSFLLDASVEAPPATLREYVFDRLFLGSRDGDNMITLENWMNKYLPGHQGDLLLQMDIEGFEYPVLMESSLDTLRRFRIIVIEFHFIEQLINQSMFGILREAFEKILRDFSIVHIHPNNVRGCNRVGSLLLPNLLEITFLRNDRIKWKQPAKCFPHPLDRRNVKSSQDVVLPDCLHG
jgi:hypothetical protein